MISWNALTLVAVLIPAGYCYEAYVQDGLERMNLYRERHHAPPLQLDDGLMQLAQQCADYYAEKGEGDHTCPYKGSYGENIGWKSNSETPPSKRLTTVKTVDEWYTEYKDYNFVDPSVSNGGVTGHFTQLVWVGVQKVGIGAAQNEAKKATFVVALYDPRGNTVVKGNDRYKYYKQNVLLP